MNLHGKIVNLQPDQRRIPEQAGWAAIWKDGHRDARHAAAELANKADAEIAKLRNALTSLMCHFPTDSDMVQLGWESGFIEAACKAHDNARAVIGAPGFFEV